MKALIVVDVQNDFTHPDGNLYVKGSEEVIEAINDLTTYYDNIFYTQDWHPLETSHFGSAAGQWPAHCVAGTWGAEFNDNLVVRPLSPPTRKGVRADEDGYSGFYADTPLGKESTDLDNKLLAANVEVVDIVGIALDVCVKATALDAQRLGYYTTVLRYATAPVTPDGGQEAVRELRAAGVTI